MWEGFKLQRGIPGCDLCLVKSFCLRQPLLVFTLLTKISQGSMAHPHLHPPPCPSFLKERCCPLCPHTCVPVELCLCPELASAACSGLGWKDLLLGRVGTHPPGQISADSSSLHSPNPTSTGEKRKQLPSAVFIDWPEKKPQWIMALNPAPTLAPLMIPPTHRSHTPHSFREP